MQHGHQLWFRSELGNEEFDQDTRARAQRMAERCIARFGGVLGNIAERSADALDRKPDVAHLPIGPQQIAGNFLVTMKALKFDEYSIEIVQELFNRFVLDRLGQLYGDCNVRLQEAGFMTRSEQEAFSRVRA